jgi:hypothetical protein
MNFRRRAASIDFEDAASLDLAALFGLGAALGFATLLGLAAALGFDASLDFDDAASLGFEDNGLLPNGQDHAAGFGADAVRAPGGADEHFTGVVETIAIELAAGQDQDDLGADVAMHRQSGAGAIAEERRRRAAIFGIADARYFNPFAKWFPVQGG